MDVNADLATIAIQERELTFARFDSGSRRAASWPVVVEVRSFHHEMLSAALPGSSSENVHRARRKRNVVERFHRSSHAVVLGLLQRDDHMADVRAACGV